MLPSLSQSPKWCGRAFGHVSKRAWTASVFKARNRREKGKLSKDVTNAITTHSKTFSVPRCLPEMRHSWQNHSSQNTRIGIWDSTSLKMPEIQTLPRNIQNKNTKRLLFWMLMNDCESMCNAEALGKTTSVLSWPTPYVVMCIEYSTSRTKHRRIPQGPQWWRTQTSPTRSTPKQFKLHQIASCRIWWSQSTKSHRWTLTRHLSRGICW